MHLQHFYWCLTLNANWGRTIIQENEFVNFGCRILTKFGGPIDNWVELINPEGQNDQIKTLPVRPATKSKISNLAKFSDMDVGESWTCNFFHKIQMFTEKWR